MLITGTPGTGKTCTCQQIEVRACSVSARSSSRAASSTSSLASTIAPPFRMSDPDQFHGF